MTCLDNVVPGELTKFGKLQWHVDPGKWMTPTTLWVKLPMAKDDGGGGFG